MGILKDQRNLSVHGGHFGYTDQRSDGDTERPATPGTRSIVSSVTQTNDPMGILKEADHGLGQAIGPGYTDQRSDGDTESQLR